MNRFLALALFIFAGGASAGYDGAQPPALEPGSVTLRVRAEVVTLPITLLSNKKDVAESVQALAAAKSALEASVRRQKGWEIRALGFRAPSGGAGKFISSGPAPAELRFIVLVPMPEPTTALDAMAAASRWLAQQKADGIEMLAGGLTHTIRDPQKYRAQLVKLLADELTRTREAVQPASIARVGSLDNAVQSRPIDEQEVELFLNYTIVIERAGATTPGR